MGQGEGVKAMTFTQELKKEIKAIFETKWNKRDGRVVPDSESVTLGNDSIELEATVLYADLVASTDLVDGYKNWFSAEVYKAYLSTACKIIRNNSGEITAFDGDRVMGIFIGDSKNSDAAKTALQIEWAVKNLINKTLKEVYPNNTYLLKQVIGIDTSKLFIAKTGIRDSNDLVWVGKSANYAAKLCAIREEGFHTYITNDVFLKLNDKSKYGGTPKRLMWEERHWEKQKIKIHRSNWHWSLD